MNKLFAALAVVAFVLGLGFGFLWHGQQAAKTPVLNRYGAVIGYLSSQGSQLTFNAFNSLALDLGAVRAPLAGMLATTTATLTWPSVTTSTPVTTSTALGIAAAAGDLILIMPSVTSTGIVYTPTLLTASTTSATVEIHAVSANGTLTPNATAFKVWVLPASSFVAPAALLSSTSTSSN